MSKRFPKPIKLTVDATPAAKRRARRIDDRLIDLYPHAHCRLDHDNAWQLLVATILSAQCTDELVNKVTPDLFKAYPTPEAMARSTVPAITKLIKRVGLFNGKAKNLHATAVLLADDHAGQVPQTLDELITLPGVARKTANVVLGNAFGINVGMVVDTHIGRLAHRLGFTTADPKNAVQVERDLMALFPADRYTDLAHRLIFHGRALCTARHPKCDQCPLRRSCPRQGVES
ncbi:MAG: endonuclease III [Planctomycetota bacterium]